MSACLVSALLAAAPAAAQGRDLRADAGPDRFLLPPATSIELAGTVRGVKVSRVPSDTVVSWVQTEGPDIVIEDGDTLTPLVTPSRAGKVSLRLKVSDPDLGIDSDEMSVYVFGANQDGTLLGSARRWHKLTLRFEHDAELSESGPVNPFLDLRLVTRLYHPATGTLLAVPGFFAADGNAAETGAMSGNVWCTNFTPEHAGTWYYAASFRGGTAVALDPDDDAGTASSFDGATGAFTVRTADPSSPGFLAAGRLDYVGGHHLRFAETREHYLKGGAGSPENFLAYYEFDGTSDLGGSPNDLNTSGWFDGLHHYDAHLADYVDLGVPLWNGKGRRILGALSYLASRGVNSLYTVTYNVDGGDGQEVFPWRAPNDKLRFDVSKLAQWERVADHMSRAGIVWHVVTQETENDHALDGGELGTQRKLYYRELVARFAHAPGLVWNLGEENTNTTEQRMAFAEHLRALDPYDHPIAIHNVVGDLFGTLIPLLGTHLEAVSIQGDPTNTPPRAQQLVTDSAAAGRPWVVNFDEQTPASHGVVPDAFDFWHDDIRRNSLWPMLVGQGGGLEWYFGNGFPHADLDCEDFRSRENMWTLTARARDFVRGQAPFEAMEHADALAAGMAPKVLALRGETYLVYLPSAGAVTLDLEAFTGPFRVRWFDARNGGALRDGTVIQVSGPGVVSLGAPPGTGDWAAVVRRLANLAPEIESLVVEPHPFTAGADFAILVHARDPNGPADPLTAEAELRTPAGVLLATLPLAHRGGSLYSYFLPTAPSLAAGTWQVGVVVHDAAGASASDSTTFEAD